MSFFASLLEGTANAANTSLGNYQKRQQVLEDDERSQAQAIERFKQQEQIRQEMTTKAEQDKQARLQGQMGQAEIGGAKLTQAQRARELTDAGVGDVATLTPEQEGMISKAKGLRYGTPLAQIGNELTAARQGGMYEAATVLSAAYKETVAAAKAEYDRLYAERKDDREERKTDALEKRTDAQAAAWGRKGSGDGSTDRRESLVAERNSLVTQLGQYREAGMPLNVQDPAIQSLLTRIDKVDSLLDGKRAGKDADTKDKQPTAPAGAQPKAGDTQVVATGKHKGKTAVFDGTGWTLK